MAPRSRWKRRKSIVLKKVKKEWNLSEGPPSKFMKRPGGGPPGRLCNKATGILQVCYSWAKPVDESLRML